jgi:hypothetical protein
MTKFATFEDDPYYAKVREICESMPGVDMKISHSRPAFFTKNIFAIYGGVTKGDHHSGRYDRSLLVLPSPEEAQALREDPRFFIPGYYGPFGWVGLDFTAAKPDWVEVRELIEESFRMTAPRSLVKQLDA